MTRFERIKQIIKETDVNYSPYYNVIPNLIKQRGYTKGIEIGVFCGGHAKSILGKTNLNLLIGIDPYQYYEPGMPGFNDQEDFNLLSILANVRLNYKGRYNHIRETSDVAYEKYLKDQIEQYDFVFIDGLHTYEQCKKDLGNYSKLIKKGGVIACHDYNHPTFPKLTNAIDEFVKKHKAKLIIGPLHLVYIEKTWSENIKEEIVFNEEDYLLMYPDVAAAITKGWFKTGYEHYVKYGKKEGRRFNLNQKLDEYIDSKNPSWSNHLTLKGYKEKPRVPSDKLNMVDVPEEFKQVQSVEYPQGNKIPFERYFEGYFIENRPETLRKYLPIHWTSYYVNNKYGTDKEALSKLQDFINTLPKDEKYFTIIQYDDGILNDISGLDIIVYSMGCNKPGYYPIPLLSYPLCASPFEIGKKDILYSFIGANTHPIRVQLEKELSGKPNSRVTLGNTTYERYIDNLKRSVFCLAPRGYGVTSFRLYEGMTLGCIPIYISDEFWEPFNLPFTEYGIKIRPEEIKDIPKILDSVDVLSMQYKVEEYYKKYFVYSSCADNIVKTLQ